MGIPEQLREIAIQRRSMESEKWKLDQRQQGHNKCLGNPRTCGSGIWKAGLRMSAWEQINAGKYTGGGGFSGHDPYGDSKKYKTRQEMQRAVYGQEYVDRRNRVTELNRDIEANKVREHGLIEQWNAEKMQLADQSLRKELASEHAKLAATERIAERKAQAKGGHPEYGLGGGTYRPPPRRAKSGVRSRYQAPKRRSAPRPRPRPRPSGRR